jgi:hypothetical protein
MSTSRTIGLPAETKDRERRIALTPAAVAADTDRGHRVLVQAGIDPIQDLRLIIRRQLGESVPSQKRILMPKPKLVNLCPVGKACGDKIWCRLGKDAQ